MTKAVYHRGSHMEGTVALKHGLKARGILTNAAVRPPLLDLRPGPRTRSPRPSRAPDSSDTLRAGTPDAKCRHAWPGR